MTVQSSSDAVQEFWTEHNVTLHRRYASAAESLADLRWRNAQYYRYIDLMPVSGADDLVVLDFGCGPGHDLVGFATESKPRRLIGVDVSTSSLAEAKDRLDLHGVSAELLCLDVSKTQLPMADASVDLVHASGVLHHLPALETALCELRRVLKPTGRAQIMIYHADSLWLNLYVAHERQILSGIDSDLSLMEAFQKSTDGPGCPVSRCFTQQQFTDIVESAGFRARSFGVAVSVFEMTLLPKRFAAIMNQQLPESSREFLTGLTFDEYGLPLTRPGVHAGIDACFQLVPV